MNDETIQLRDQVGVLRRRWRVVAITCLLVVAAGVAITLLQPRVYVAQSVVLIEPDPLIGAESVTEENVATEAINVTSFETLQRVVESLGLSDDPSDLAEDVTGTPDDTGAAVVTIAVARGDAEEAAAIANEVATTYLESARGAIITPATVPDGPSSPKPARNIGLATLVGLLLGVGVAYLRDYFDDVVRNDRALEDALPGVPVLAHIPHWRRHRSDRHQPLVTESPQSRTGEAYRALGVSVRTLLDQPHLNGAQAKHARVIQLASAVPGEGKTTVAVNLAVVVAQAGLRTVLVEADLRQPAVAELLRLDSKDGLSDVLSGRMTARELLARVDGVANLMVLPAGGTHGSPAELLTSPRRRELIDMLRGECDLVLVDGPDVLGVADALELARDADAVVLAVRQGTSQRKQLAAALYRLSQVNAPVSGVVVSNADDR
ncbi:MAG: polysaccharide biosynthesis tyrosine autokinase [Actinomycetota bacterium]|nr:polysaccharide biosynthesis tyrosine autokinase [Actinomycetota bacterium]